jgi:hypothetical protein
VRRARDRLAALWLGIALTASLGAGCTGLRKHQEPTPAEPAPAPVESTESAAPPAAENNTDSSVEVKQPEAAANNQNCSCLEAKPTRPKPKPKPKPVHKEAPPQLPTAPVVAEAPPGAVVNAQVRQMSVSVMSILGKRVQGANGEDLGRVVDVLADASGRVRVAIIDFGGFLGVGNHRIAVDWPLLRFSPDTRDPSLLLSLSREKLQTAPEYKENPRPQALMEPPAPTPPAASDPAAATPAVATPADGKK